MRLVALISRVLLVLALVGCAQQATTPDVAQPEPTPAPAPGDAAGGTRPAPGVYELDERQIQAVGTLAYSDLEGGFWLITGGTEAEGNLGETVIVIANGEEFAEQLKALEGALVAATGERFEGASIRMAGPEMTLRSITEIVDAGGAAE